MKRPTISWPAFFINFIFTPAVALLLHWSHATILNIDIQCITLVTWIRQKVLTTVCMEVLLPCCVHIAPVHGYQDPVLKLLKSFTCIHCTRDKEKCKTFHFISQAGFYGSMKWIIYRLICRLLPIHLLLQQNAVCVPDSVYKISLSCRYAVLCESEKQNALWWLSPSNS